MPQGHVMAVPLVMVGHLDPGVAGDPDLPWCSNLRSWSGDMTVDGVPRVGAVASFLWFRHPGRCRTMPYRELAARECTAAGRDLSNHTRGWGPVQISAKAASPRARSRWWQRRVSLRATDIAARIFPSRFRDQGEVGMLGAAGTGRAHAGLIERPAQQRRTWAGEVGPAAFPVEGVDRDIEAGVAHGLRGGGEPAGVCRRMAAARACRTGRGKERRSWRRTRRRTTGTGACGIPRHAACPLAWMSSYQPSVNPLSIAIRVGAARWGTIDASTVVPLVAVVRGHADSAEARCG